MDRLIYDILQEPVGDVYHALIDASMYWCESALLIVREDILLNDSGSQVLGELGPFLVRKDRSAKWPGTELLDGKCAEVYNFRLCKGCVEVLKESAAGLYSWVQPSRPEDLCLLRPGGSIWLASIAHQTDAYMEMTSREAGELVARVPGLAFLLSARGTES